MATCQNISSVWLNILLWCSRIYVIQLQQLLQLLLRIITQYANVTQCHPENTHGEFQPSNRNELLPKSPPFHGSTGEGQLIPSLTLSCKGTDGSGNGSGRLHGYIPRGDFNPSLSPSTSNTLVHFGQTKENLFFLTFLTRITIATTQINIWIFNVYSFPHRHDVMISSANYLGQCGNF